MNDEVKPRMVVTDHLDGSYPNARDYEVNSFISDGLYNSDDFRANGELRDVLGKRACEHTENLMVALKSVGGVAKVIFWRDDPFRACIYKGGAFDWDDVEPGIITAFRGHLFGWGGEVPIAISRTTKYGHLRDETGALRRLTQ